MHKNRCTWMFTYTRIHARAHALYTRSRHSKIVRFANLTRMCSLDRICSFGLLECSLDIECVLSLGIECVLSLDIECVLSLDIECVLSLDIECVRLAY